MARSRPSVEPPSSNQYCRHAYPQNVPGGIGNYQILRKPWQVGCTNPWLSGQVTLMGNPIPKDCALQVPILEVFDGGSLRGSLYHTCFGGETCTQHSNLARPVHEVPDEQMGCAQRALGHQLHDLCLSKLLAAARLICVSRNIDQPGSQSRCKVGAWTGVTDRRGTRLMREMLAFPMLYLRLLPMADGGGAIVLRGH